MRESVERTLSRVGEAAAAAELQSTAVESTRYRHGRRTARVHARTSIVPVVLQTSDGRRVETHTVDLSGGGMLLEQGSLALGATVDFQLELGPDEPPIAGRARVVRITEEGRSALAFEQVHVADHERLIEYIARREGSNEPRFTGP